MARIQLSRSAATTIQEAQPTAVFIKRTWGAAWKLLPYLEWAQATHACAPAVSSAVLMWRYGSILHEDRTSFVTRPPLELSGWYVQLRTLTANGSFPFWTGRICADQLNADGNLVVGSSSIPTGTQTFQAFGMEHELDLTPCLGAYVDDGSTLQIVTKMPQFNRRQRYGGGYQGNRSTATGTNSSYNFSSNGETWSNYDIADYIIKNHAPRLVAADQWSFVLTGQLTPLGYIIEEHNLEGLTVKQILDHLIDRRRGLGWYIAPIGTTAGEKISIVVYSCFGQAVSAGDMVIPGNDKVIRNWPIGSDRRMQDCVVVRNRSERVDAVTVTGSPLKSIMTLTFANALEKGWTETEEAAYLVGDSDNPTNAELCDIERCTDKYRRVFRVFRVKKTWDTTILDPDGITSRYAFPLIMPDGTIDETVPGYFWNYGKSFERYLPIYKPSANIAEDGTREPEFVEPIVFVQDATAKWRQVDAANPDGSAFAQVRCLDREMAIEVAASVNHKLALTYFDPLIYPTAPENNPVYNYATIKATVCIESDQRVLVTMIRPDSPTLGARGLNIDVPRAQVWRIMPYTYLGVTNGALTAYADGTYTDNLLRDDRQAMRQICALALAWFGDDRAQVSITSVGLLAPPPLGSYLERVSDSRGSMRVATIITSHTWRNSQGKEQMPTTSIETGFDAPDFRSLIEFPGMSDIRAVSREIRRIRSEQDEIADRIGNMPVRFGSTGGGGGSGTVSTDPYWIYAIGYGGSM